MKGVDSDSDVDLIARPLVRPPPRSRPSICTIIFIVAAIFFVISMCGVVGATFLDGTVNYVVGSITIPATILSLVTICGSQLCESRHLPRVARS